MVSVMFFRSFFYRRLKQIYADLRRWKNDYCYFTINKTRKMRASF